MATFAKATFNATRYAASRPTYPRQLFDYIKTYHESGKNARWETAVDVGCGTGQATVELAGLNFTRVFGFDTSSSMLQQAQESIVDNPKLAAQISFTQSAAEDLHALGDGSVDLMTAAQAAHWFNWDRFWPEAARVLRNDGTFAAWIYSEFRLSRYPSATPLVNDYAQGSDPETSLGPHWERPGRTVLENHLLEVPNPTKVLPDQFSDFQRVFFTGNHYPSLPGTHLPVILHKTMTWAELMEYLRTWSSLHTFHGKHPEDLNHHDGDIATRFWMKLKEEVARVDDKEIPIDEENIEIEWPLALILARRV